MKNYIKLDGWKVIEDNFNPDFNEVSESIFSLGNGKTGLRGNFEEQYSGKSLQGSYNAGIYYPDKTRVGWWKNGYPEYFAKVLNSCNWIGLNIRIDDFNLDISNLKLSNFNRTLDMQKGVLSRSFEGINNSGVKINVSTTRFTSMMDDEIACLEYTLKVDGKFSQVKVESFLDFDILNKDSNYDEKFWIGKKHLSNNEFCFVQAETLKTAFNLGLASFTQIEINGIKQILNSNYSKDKFASHTFDLAVNTGDEIKITKYVGFASSLYYDIENIENQSVSKCREASDIAYQQLLDGHINQWKEIWKNSDITIEGDTSAQQGIRFNIFHLKQTYSGKDSRLNIGPKGFTGEKYGGSTYWDTEAYCLPFYQSTSDKEVALQLLKYRHNHLQKAIENAQKLGFKDGAALYPMVTMNGEECHNEWEITFEEIHRNGAIAYAIYDFIKYTGDDDYLRNGGLEVLIGISRFWSQRVNFSEEKNQFVILGVTGPNEYENNVNNNWYTNYIAKWCLSYTLKCLENHKENHSSYYKEIYVDLNLKDHELQLWEDICKNMYFPYNTQHKIFLQQDGFLDKVLSVVNELPEDEKPIHQNWSWDRILRSVYIKQADVLQGLYFFEDDFSIEVIRSNFDFYEPSTVHESSLSPCVHCILACMLKMDSKAYEMYLRTSRLDLDDYNNDTEDGLHITSMAGTWMSIVKGFGGMRIKNNQLHFKPYLPKQWKACSFKIVFRGSLIQVHLDHNENRITKETGELSSVFVDGEEILLH